MTVNQAELPNTAKRDHASMNYLFTIKSLYAMNGFVAVLLYIPQILSACKNRHNAFSVSLVTFGGWTVGSLITAVYAWIIVKDAMFTAVSLGNTIGSGAVFLIIAGQRLMCRKEHAAPSNPVLDLQR